MLSSIAPMTAEPAAQPATLPTSTAITAPARPPNTVSIWPAIEPTTSSVFVPASAAAVPPVAPATLLLRADGGTTGG